MYSFYIFDWDSFPSNISDICNDDNVSLVYKIINSAHNGGFEYKKSWRSQWVSRISQPILFQLNNESLLKFISAMMDIEKQQQLKKTR